MHTSLVWAVCVSSIAFAAPALAQRTSFSAEDLAAAREGLLVDAHAASDTGDHLHALDLAERAAAIGSDASLRLFIARQANALGLLQEAYGAAALCRTDARENEAAVVAQCEGMLNDLGGLMGRLTVRVDPGVANGMVVRVGGHALPSALYNAPDRVTPGHLVIEWQREGEPMAHEEIDVTAGEEVVIDTGQPAVTEAVILAPSAAVPLVAHDDSGAVTSFAHTPASPRRPNFGAPIVLIALGVVTAANSVQLLVRADEGPAFGPLGWTMIGSGLAASAAGAIWIAATAHTPVRPPPMVTAFAVPMRDGAVLGLGGRF